MTCLADEQNTVEVKGMLQNGDLLIKEHEEEFTEFLMFRNEEIKSDNASRSNLTLKRKRKTENYFPLNILTDIFFAYFIHSQDV